MSQARDSDTLPSYEEFVFESSKSCGNDRFSHELEVIRHGRYSTDKHLGETWYIVATKWFQAWEMYVGGASNTANPWQSAIAGDSSLHPGPVDNSPLVDSKTGELKPLLKEPVDFKSIPEEAWDLLIQNYGVSAKLPRPLKCKVIPGAYNSYYNKLEVYPLRIDLRMHQELGKSQLLLCSRVDTIQELIYRIKKDYQVSSTSELQLWFRRNCTVPLFLVKDWDDTLQKLDSENGSLLVVETRNAWESWPSSTSAFEESAKEHGIYLSTNETLPPPSSPPKYGPTTTNAWNRRKDTDEFEGTTNYKFDGTLGLCGLQNLGNTCFMASAIQCLSNVPELTDFFRTGAFKSCINKANKLGTGGQLVEKYAALINTMWSGKYGSVSPRSFKTTLGQFAPRFMGYSQQDSSELMSYVLEGLHEDLNEVTVKPYQEIAEKEGLSDAEIGEEYWDCHKKRNCSKIVDLFHGQLKSTLRCNVCSKVAFTFDPFCYLSVPLPKPTTKKVFGHFRFFDPAKPVMNLNLDLPLNFNIKHVRQAISELTQVPESLIKVCSVNKTQSASLSYWYPDDDLAIYMNPVYDDLMAFEMEELTSAPNQNLLVPAIFYVKTPSSQRIYPFLRLIPKAKLTSALIHRIASSLTEPFRTKSEEDDSFLKVFMSNTSGTYDYDELIPENDSDSDDFENRLVMRSIYFTIKWSATVNEASNHYDFDKMAVTSSTEDDTPDSSADIKLDDCLRLFTSEEQLSELDSWYCPRCKTHQRAFKKLDLWRLPPYLIIHLKRFEQNPLSTSSRVEKLDIFVNYPFKLDLSSFGFNTESNETIYELIAVSNHFGSLSFGHYTAYAINQTTGKWFLFDDANVESVSESQEVISDAGYLLIYRRI